MSKKTNPASVGLFILVGLLLAVAGVLVFSAGTLFRKQEKYILYFNVSLKGLDPGAPVKFRGVTIGKVTEVLVRHNQASDDFAMPVIIAIDTKLTQSKSDEHVEFGKDRLSYLIREGFRARLDADSRTMRAHGNPKELLEHSPDTKLRAFLTRGELAEQGTTS